MVAEIGFLCGFEHLPGILPIPPHDIPVGLWLYVRPRVQLLGHRGGLWGCPEWDTDSLWECGDGYTEVAALVPP